MQINQIPAFKDNYIYMLHGANQTAVVDPGLAAPVLEFLRQHNFKLDYILNTHHHSDHVGGNIELKNATGAKIVGYKNDAQRIPGIDVELNDNDKITICGQLAQIMFIPGHTTGHIAYYFAAQNSLFCGDTVFSMGCGRLFEGTPQQMFDSLRKIKNLSCETDIYCAHEYTQNNGIFASTIMPDNQDLKARMAKVAELRKHNQPTIPTKLSIELKTNPFLMADNVAEFARIRKLKDDF